MIPLDGPGYGEIVAEVADLRAELATYKDRMKEALKNELRLNARGCRDAAKIVRLRTLGIEMLAALRSAVTVANEAAEEWDKAPAGMRAGKILLALAGHRHRYRPDTDAIHLLIEKAAASLEIEPPSPPPENGSMARPRQRDSAGAAPPSFIPERCGND